MCERGPRRLGDGGIPEEDLHGDEGDLADGEEMRQVRLHPTRQRRRCLGSRRPVTCTASPLD